ncbi:MAG: hypothetical protein KDB01_26850, partial [Planctomycetaceae bacterium]|nr:hypothetical protein [Planctomycetaceae bacterium]
MNTTQTLSRFRSQSVCWLPLVIASILLSFSNSTVAAQEASPQKTHNDGTEVSEPIKSQITSLEEEIEKLKQFNELVNQYNQLIKGRRFAEAELVGKKARELQTNEPHAILMVEKAKMYRQLAFNESVRKRKEGIADDISVSMGSVIDAVEQPITSIAEYRRQLDALEQPVLQLAEQVRVVEKKQGKDHPDSEKLRADLRALVQQTFVARQEIQRAELAEFTRRLQRMQQAIETRERIVDRIVDRRVEELLDPNLNWTPSQGGQDASAFSPKPPESLDVGQIGKNVQKVTLTMFDVTDANFMKEREIDAEPSLAPTDLDEQLKKMKDSKTLKILGSHTIETTLNRTATFHSGGTFEVPSASLLNKTDIEFGTTIEIKPQMRGVEKVFECVWNERLIDHDDSAVVGGIPGVNEEQWRVAIISPLPGGSGYLCGPFPRRDSGHRRFISFYLHATSEPTTGQSKELGPFALTPSRSELLPMIDAMLRDIEEFQQRTPLKLLLEIKDESVLQISSDFYETVRTLKEDVEQNRSNTKLNRSFGHVASQGKSFVSKFSGLQSQGVQDTLRALEHGIATIRKLIDLDTADAVFIGEQDSQPSEKCDVTDSPALPPEISVVDGSLTADADGAAASERAEAVLVDLKPYYSAVAKDFEKATRFPWKW